MTNGRAAELAALARALGFWGGGGSATPAIDATLVELAIAEQVAPLLAARWQEGRVRVADEGALRRLTRERLAATGAHLAVERGAVPLVTALAARGVPAMAFKGRALIATVYADGGLRPRVDTDLLVPAGRWREALAAARDAGLEVVESPGRALTLRRYHEVHLQGAAGSVVDLHRALGAWPLFAVDHDALFARAAREADGLLIPEPADLFVSLALAAAQDGFFVPFRALVDGLALAATGKVDPARVAARAREWRAVRATATWLRALLRFGLDGEAWEPAVAALDRRGRTVGGAAAVPRGHRGSRARRIWAMRWHLARSLDGAARPAAFFTYRGLLWAGDLLWRLPRRAGRPDRCPSSAS